MPEPTNYLADLSPASPTATPAAANPPPAAPGNGPRPLPPDPVFQLPPIKATLEGDIAGFWTVPADVKRPEYQLALKNKQLLVNNGLVIYPMKNGGQAVFNPAVIGLHQVQALDKHGKLDNILKPLGALLASPSPTPASQPAAANPPPSGPAPIPQAPPVPPPTAKTTPAAVSRPLAAADAKQYAAPTTRASKRPTPGAGSLLQTLQVQPK